MDPAADEKSLAARRRSRTVVAWQGWRLEVPGRWSPTKLEGDYDRGYALLTSGHRPRLGLRWRRPRADGVAPQAWVESALYEEVGALAAERARPLAMDGWAASRLHVDPARPGRDVWMGYSERSGRTLEVVYHAYRRDHALAGSVLPALRDLPQDRPMPWATYELNCVVPAGLRLERHRLSAGDLSLSFAGRGRLLTVRQIAVAELALKRMPLEKWLATQQRLYGDHYRAVGHSDLITAPLGGRSVGGLRGRMVRRRRFLWKWRMLPADLVTYALHDEARDRLLFVQAGNDALAAEVLVTVGSVGK